MLSLQMPTPHVVAKMVKAMGSDLLVNDETLAKGMLIMGKNKADVRTFMHGLRRRGMCNTKSNFTPPEAPDVPIASILDDNQTKKLLRLVNLRLLREPPKSPTFPLTLPLSKFAEIKLDDTIMEPEIFNALLPCFPRCKKLMLQRARDKADLPEVPLRVFVSKYPKQIESGMSCHRDCHTAHGAVTISLTNDCLGGSFFTSAAVEIDNVLDVPLRKGQALAIRPSDYHGVHTSTRKYDRVTITLFY